MKHFPYGFLSVEPPFIFIVNQGSQFNRLLCKRTDNSPVITIYFEEVTAVRNVFLSMNVNGDAVSAQKY
jgi:hypothetical protein